MAREVRDYSGGAVDTTLTSAINSTDLTIPISDATGWPSGGANGPFFVVIDYDLAGIEKVEVASRTGTTLTVANTGKRGVDDTAATSHSSGAKIRHCGTAQDMAEFNSHAFDTTIDDHGQYMRTDGTRHDLSARHAVGTVIAAATPGSIEPDDTAAEGVAASVARSDHTHGNTTAAAGTIQPDDTAAEGVATSFSRSDHKHAIVADTAAAISGTAAEGSATSFARSDHDHSYGAASIPGSALMDAIVTMAKLADETSVDWGSTLTLTGVTLGTGGSKYAHYWKFGRLILMLAGFELGTGGNVTATIQFSLPFTPLDLAGFSGSNAGGGFTAATARDSSTQQRHSGIGAIRVDLDTATDYVVAGQSIGWAASTPFDWTNGDTLEIIAVFEVDPA